MSPLSIVRRQVGGVPVIEVHGDLDFASVSALRDALASEVSPSNGGLALDLAATTYLDSAGVHLLVQLAENLRSHRQQLRVVVAPASPIRRVIVIAGLEGLLHLEESVAAATSALGADGDAEDDYGSA